MFAIVRDIAMVSSDQARPKHPDEQPSPRKQVYFSELKLYIVILFFLVSILAGQDSDMQRTRIERPGTAAGDTAAPKHFLEGLPQLAARLVKELSKRCFQGRWCLKTKLNTGPSAPASTRGSRVQLNLPGSVQKIWRSEMLAVHLHVAPNWTV